MRWLRRTAGKVVQTKATKQTMHVGVPRWICTHQWRLQAHTDNQ